MWLEIKSMMTVMGIIFIMVGVMVFSADLSVMMLLIVFMGIGFMVFSDIILGYQITNNELKPVMDKTPPGMELTIFQEIGGKIHFINTKKAEMGIRRFRWHNKEAGVINDGIGMFITPNGNRGFFSHESFDKSISMVLCKALEDIAAKTDSKDIKEIYENAMTQIEEIRGGRVHVEG